MRTTTLAAVPIFSLILASAASVLAQAPRHTGEGVAPPPPVVVMSVGPNVQVSRPFPRLGHFEPWAAGDANHAGRLLACSEVEHMDLASRSQHCYVSFDDGKTWSTVLELDEGPLNADPAMTYGRGDTGFAMSLTQPGRDTTKKSLTHVYRSVDGGRAFQEIGRASCRERV